VRAGEEEEEVGHMPARLGRQLDAGAKIFTSGDKNSLGAMATSNCKKKRTKQMWRTVEKERRHKPREVLDYFEQLRSSERESEKVVDKLQKRHTLYTTHSTQSK
jgi:hypothetical protein